MNFIRSIIFILCTSSCFAGVYGDLEFGDSRKVVHEKLRVSPLIIVEETENIFGNVNLNGIYRCKAQMAGLTYHLHFDWTNSGHLRLITLKSEDVDLSKYDTEIFHAWTTLGNMLTHAYDKPTISNDFPSSSELQDDKVLISHTWNYQKSVDVMLGLGLKDETYHLAIKYVPTKPLVTTEKANE
ncbi:MAG: hypothetical protein ACSHX0_07435 [Akkermansiaceae bacterium]